MEKHSEEAQPCIPGAPKGAARRSCGSPSREDLARARGRHMPRNFRLGTLTSAQHLELDRLARPVAQDLQRDALAWRARQPPPGVEVVDGGEVVLASGGEEDVTLVQPGADRFLAERSEEHTSELQSLRHLVCRLL